MNVIIYPNDAGISVIYPSGIIPIDEVALKDVPPETQYIIINESELPLDTAFFNAWDANFNNYQGITVNLEKSKVIYKSVADSQSTLLSAPLTQEYMRLLAIGADTTAVQAQLRAINAAAEETAYLDATTVDELIACWPPELGPNPFLPATTVG